MKHICRFALWFILLICARDLTAADRGTIKGQLKSSSGKLDVSRTLVIAKGGFEQRVASVEGNGAFTFPDLAPGTYKITVVSKDFCQDANNIPEVTVPGAASSKILDILLTPCGCSDDLKIGSFEIFNNEYRWLIDSKAGSAYLYIGNIYTPGVRDSRAYIAIGNGIFPERTGIMPEKTFKKRSEKANITEFKFTKDGASMDFRLPDREYRVKVDKIYNKPGRNIQDRVAVTFCALP